MKKLKFLIIIFVCVTVMLALSLSSFAISDVNLTYSIDNNNYYLFRYYNNTAGNFRIYTQSYYEQPDLYIDDIGWVVDASDIGYDSKLNDMSSFLYYNQNLYDNCLLNSLINIFHNYVIDPANQLPSRLFNNYTVAECFYRGFYAVNSAFIDNTTVDTFQNLINDINNGSTYYNAGCDFYFHSLNNAMVFNALKTNSYYDQDFELLNNKIIFMQTPLFRDMLCNSIMNIIHYELGFNDVSYNNIMLSDIYKTVTGDNDNFIGSPVILYQIQSHNSGLCIYGTERLMFNYNYSQNFTFVGALNKAFDSIKFDYYFSWVPKIGTLSAVFTSTVILGIVVAGKKAIFV